MDNAKELILDKINCGSNLANMYLFMITLGYNIEDIVSFMVSPVVTFIDNVINSNIFSGTYIDINMALALAQGNFNEKLFAKFVNNNTIISFKTLIRNIYKDNQKTTNKQNPFVDISKEDSLYKQFLEIKPDNFETFLNDAITSFKNGNVEEFQNVFALNSRFINSQMSNEIESYMYFVQSIKNLRDFDPNNKEVKQDIEEFRKIREGAKEFTNAAKFLGINQGIKTSKSELNRFIQSMQDAYADRVKDSDKNFEPLDVQKFLEDDVYKQQIINKYNDSKVCLNIFAMIDQIPQYNSLYKLLGLVINLDNNISIKSRIFNNMYAELKKRKYKYIPEDYQKGMLRGIDNAIISTYVTNELDIKIPYQKGTNLIDNFGRDYSAKEDGSINFSDIGQIESFKKYFEEVIIPGLRRGVIYDLDENNIVQEKSIPGLKENYFIRSLIKTRDKNMPLYKCNIDMMTAKNTESNQKQLSIYITGLRELTNDKYLINGTKLSDLFMLYNLIVNKNNYGSDRMTTLFESFIKNNLGENNLIYKYLSWLGRKDFFLEDKDINVKLEDVMLAASRISKYPPSTNDPSYLHLSEDGTLQFKLKQSDNTYKNSEIDLLVPITDQSVETRIQRIKNYQKYNTLGGTFDNYLQSIYNSIKNLDENALSSIRELIRKGVLTIERICK